MDFLCMQRNADSFVCGGSKQSVSEGNYRLEAGQYPDRGVFDRPIQLQSVPKRTWKSMVGDIGKYHKSAKY